MTVKSAGRALKVVEIIAHSQPIFADLASIPILQQFVTDGGYVHSLGSLEGAFNAVDQGYANELVGYSWGASAHPMKSCTA